MIQPHPRGLVAAAAALIGCLLLAACSSAPTQAKPPLAHDGSAAASASSRSSPATPSAGTSHADRAAAANACALVTEHEAGVALGSDPGAGHAVTAHGAYSCTYGTAPTIVTVNLLAAGGRAAYDHARTLAPAGRVVDLHGVGTAAFGVFTGPAAEIWFYHGDSMVAVGVINGAATSPPQAAATALAKTAAGRI